MLLLIRDEFYIFEMSGKFYSTSKIIKEIKINNVTF